MFNSSGSCPMKEPCGRRLVLAYLLLVPLLAEQPVQSMQQWYMVDVPEVVCTLSSPPAPGKTQVTVSLDAINKKSPHVFTLFRTSNQSVSVEFQVTDAAGKVVVRKQSVELVPMTARRLSMDVLFQLERFNTTNVAPADSRLLNASLDAASLHTVQDVRGSDSDAVGRRLSSRRRAGGSSSSPRRRSSSSSSSARRRSSSSSSSSSSSGARRRANPASARRRGNPGNANAPQTGVGGSRYSNANGQSYGYTNPGRMSSNYPGGHSKTNYGYGGAMGKPNMGRNMMMAAGGGLLLGMGTMYMFSRMSSWNRCRYGSSWTGSCKECRDRYPPEECGMDIDENVNRDDLMNTGFWPDDFTGPLTVLVTSITGADLNAARVCPPTGWTPDGTSSVSWTPPDGQDIFLTLTQMAELADSLAADEPEEEVTVWQAITSILSLLACCFCCCAIPAYIIMKSRKQNRHNVEMQGYGGYDQGGYGQQYGGQPQMMYGQQQPQPMYGQPQPMYGQPQPMYGQQQAPVVMGQAIGPPSGVVMGQVVQPVAQPEQQRGAPQGYVPGMRA